MAAPKSTKQLLILLTDAFTTLKAQVQQLGSSSGGSVDAYTKAEANALLATKASKQDVANVIGAAPAALDTLAEIGAQLQADERGTAAILATQQQHSQDLAGLVRLPAFTSAQYGKVLGLTSAGVLAWLAAPVGSGGTGTVEAGGEQLEAVYVNLSDQDFDKIPVYADGDTTGTPIEYDAKIKVSRVEDIVRTINAGTTTTNPNGTVKDNVLAPTGYSFEWLRKQTFVAPAGLTAADLEYKRATSSTWLAYPGPLDVPSGAAAGYFMCRVKETATRNPSASAYSNAFSSVATTTNYQVNSGSTQDWQQRDGTHLGSVPSFDGSSTADRTRAYYGGATLKAPTTAILVNGQNYTVSVPVKMFTDEGHSIVQARFNSYDNKFFAKFDLTTGEVIERSSLAKTVSFQDMSSLGGNYVGWAMLQMGFEMQGNQTQFDIVWFPPADAFGDIVLHQPQINDGLFRTYPYLPTYT